MKLSTIRVPLTKFKVDIVICKSDEEYSRFLQKRYGFTEEESRDSSSNECNTIHSGKNGELKGEIRFLLRFEKMPKSIMPVFLHELWHLMWHISVTITDFKLDKDTQTWAANMFEELYVLIINAKYDEYETRM